MHFKGHFHIQIYFLKKLIVQAFPFTYSITFTNKIVQCGRGSSLLFIIQVSALARSTVNVNVSGANLN